MGSPAVVPLESIPRKQARTRAELLASAVVADVTCLSEHEQSRLTMERLAQLVADNAMDFLCPMYEDALRASVDASPGNAAELAELRARAEAAEAEAASLRRTLDEVERRVGFEVDLGADETLTAFAALVSAVCRRGR